MRSNNNDSGDKCKHNSGQKLSGNNLLNFRSKHMYYFIQMIFNIYRYENNCHEKSEYNFYYVMCSIGTLYLHIYSNKTI